MITVPASDVSKGDGLAAALAAQFPGAGVVLSVEGDKQVWVVSGVAESHSAAVAALIAAHVPPPPPPEIANEETLRSRADAALAANTAFLAVQSPTNAQTLAQVRLLTKAVTALVRLVVRKLDSVEGT